MSILNNLVKSKLQTSAGRWLKQRCVIEREVIITDEFGAPANVWEILQSDVPCRVITTRGGGQERVGLVGQQESLTHVYKLVVPIGVALGVNQRVTVDGATYNIVQVETALTDELFHQAVIIRR